MAICLLSVRQQAAMALTPALKISSCASGVEVMMVTAQNIMTQLVSPVIRQQITDCISMMLMLLKPKEI